MWVLELDNKILEVFFMILTDDYLSTNSIKTNKSIHARLKRYLTKQTNKLIGSRRLYFHSAAYVDQAKEMNKAIDEYLAKLKVDNKRKCNNEQ